MTRYHRDEYERNIARDESSEGSIPSKREKIGSSAASNFAEILPEHELFAQLVEVFVREMKLESVREAQQKIHGRISLQKERIRHTIIESKRAWQRKIEDQPFCRFIDKIAFVCGVVGCMITSMLLARDVRFMITWYSYLIVTLVSIR